METLPLSAVKARLSEIADEVDRTHQRVQITKNGRSYVVLISAEDLASLEATVELLSDPAAMRRVRQAQSDIDGGDFTTGEQMDQIMRSRGDAPASSIALGRRRTRRMAAGSLNNSTVASREARSRPRSARRRSGRSW